ncbi:putative ABC transporter, periplasmic substrate-binding protein [Pseudonocardia sulfidoxydans NBRC 16205]|uniref:Putative ABC transporter, periplasmic substrate-binding protein n=1 Tax=Pseudonocardia sulfidoxydans NBRC 16205 TaxID=1223511 RepID=A0A511DJ48_9PSEU|nr:iron-siderophore ABC transporter substrate-binding protein [Pseudonocardia sulfidoxydans]GEL24845.1 putative ABC transporter, periplasmic substrate-binding protein [Pseudonocardia sulfidoxydans NBRC 16205]
MRPRSLLLAAVLVLAAGCSSTAPTTPEPEVVPQAAFPVSVEHEFGTTTVPAAPQRVVSAGYTEHDTLLALGVTPVAVTDWYGDHPYATWPWAKEKLGSATPTVLTASDGPDYEKIAAQRPDLILATNAGLDRAQYDRLSAIAPTVAQPKGSIAWFGPWDAQARLIGAAVGKADEANALVDGLKKRFADTAAAHPAFAGTPAIFLQAPFYDGHAIAYQAGLSTAFLTDLGFTVPADIDRFGRTGDVSQAHIPLENLGVLNAGKVLVWGTEDAAARAELEAQPVYRTLTPVQNGNLVFTDATLAGAIYFSSPLSLPYVLDHLVPQLDAALAGNPETKPAA